MVISMLTDYFPWLGIACIGSLVMALVLAIGNIRRLQVDYDESFEKATRFDRVLAQASDGAMLLIHEPEAGTPDSCDVICSRRLAVLLALPQGEASGFAEVLQVISPESADTLRSNIQDVMHSGESFVQEVDSPGRGRTLTVSGMRADEDTAGQMTTVVWFRDVSRELEATEIAQTDISVLQHERSRYRAALDALPVPIWIRDDELNISFCNTAYAQVVGANDPMEARRENLEIIKGAEGREGRALAASARASGTGREEHEVVALGGVLRHFDVRETPLFPFGATAVMASELPELRGTVGLALDVTDRTAAHADMSRHDEAHALVLERLGTAMSVFGPDQRLQFYNTAFERLWLLDSEWLDSEPDYGTLLEVLRDRRQLPEVSNFPAYKAKELAAFTDLLEPVEALMHLPGGTTLRRVVAPHPLGGLLQTYEDVTDTLALERSYNTLIDVQAETLNHLHEAVAVFDSAGVLRLSNASFASTWDLSEVRPLPGGAEASGSALRFHEVIDLQAHLLAASMPRDVFSKHMAQVFHERDVQSGTLPHNTLGALRWQAAPLADGGMVLSYEEDTVVASQGQIDVASILSGSVQSIAGWGDVLAHGHYGDMNPRQKAYVDSIRDGASSMDRLLTAVDDIETLRYGVDDVSALDVHVALSQALTAARDRAQRREVDLHFDCVPEIGMQRLPRDAFGRLLGLILDTALSSVSPGDAMTLAAQREVGGALTITIADTGAGWDVPTLGQAEDGESCDRSAAARFAVLRTYADIQGWGFDLITVLGEGTTVTLRQDR